jgi:hypothetical protein
MDDNRKRAGHGWAIGAAFAGQVGLFVAISALAAGTAGAPAVSVAPVPAVAPLPAISAPSVPQPGMFPYRFSMYGQADGGTYSGVYPENPSPQPVYTVKPRQRAGITVTLTIPDTVRINTLWVNFTEITPDPGNALDQDQTLYYADSEPLPPGSHTFSTAWPSADKLPPGSEWLISMSTDTPGGTVDLATVTVAS